MGGLRAATVGVVALNLALHVVILALAGWAVNASMDGNPTRVSDSDATTYLTMLALIASAVGAASMIVAFHHAAHSWTFDTYAATAPLSLVAAILCLQSLGFASKGIDSGAFRCQQVKALEGLAIIVAGTQLLFVVMLQYGKLIGEYS